LKFTLNLDDGERQSRGGRMNIEGLVLEFEGLQPVAADQFEIDQKLEQLMEQSPSECSMMASFLKKGPLIRGVISIHAANGNELKAVVAGTSLRGVTNRLFGKMAVKLYEWKRTRFLPEEAWMQK
jgi:hypothetical protein